MQQDPVDTIALRALNARFIHNFVTNDLDSHESITHPRILNMSTTGRRADRETYLRSWATGFDPEVIVYRVVRDERIDDFGDTALVRSTNKHVVVQGSTEVTGMTTCTDTDVLKNAGSGSNGLTAK